MSSPVKYTVKKLGVLFLQQANCEARADFIFRDGFFHPSGIACPSSAESSCSNPGVLKARCNLRSSSVPARQICGKL